MASRHPPRHSPPRHQQHQEQQPPPPPRQSPPLPAAALSSVAAAEAAAAMETTAFLSSAAGTPTLPSGHLPGHRNPMEAHLQQQVLGRSSTRRSPPLMQDQPADIGRRRPGPMQLHGHSAPGGNGFNLHLHNNNNTKAANSDSLSPSSDHRLSPPPLSTPPGLSTPTPSSTQQQQQQQQQQQPPERKIPLVIPPPTLRPQHVYAPVAPLGMLTLGVFSKNKKKDDAQGSPNEMDKISTGIKTGFLWGNMLFRKSGKWAVLFEIVLATKEHNFFASPPHTKLMYRYIYFCDKNYSYFFPHLPKIMFVFFSFSS